MPNSVHYLSTDADRVLISENPNAGARSGRTKIDHLAELLSQEGYTVEVLTDIDRVAVEAESAMKDGSLRAVVAAGGDGTVSLVANRTPHGTPIVVLPLGTENLLSKYLEITADPDFLFQAICRGATVQLDAGSANQRIFLIMVGCGFDAEVVRRLHEGRKGHIHHLSYAKPIYDSIRSYQYPEIRVYCDAETDSPPSESPSDENPIVARWTFVVNLPRYAGGLKIVPDAVGTDGLLDVCTFKEGSLWNGMLYLSGVFLGQHQSWGDCVNRRVKKVRIESEGSVPYQLDGDPGGFLPLEIEILPKRLTLLVNENWAIKQGFQKSENPQ